MASTGRNASFTNIELIDPDTPDSACSILLCQGSYDVCDPIENGPNVKKEPMILVFSDEFEKEGREFDVQANDSRWTAENIYYFPTQDIEVYKPEQVTTYSEFCTLYSLYMYFTVYDSLVHNAITAI